MLILLVGPKGSGKTHMGRLLAERLGVHFFPVEPRWMAYHAACRIAGREPVVADGMRLVHPWIDVALERHRHVCVETTGASPEILKDLLRIGGRAGCIVVRLTAPLDRCLERIAARDPRHQITVERARVEEIHRISVALDLAADAVVENAGLDDDALLRALLVVPALQEIASGATERDKPA